MHTEYRCIRRKVSSIRRKQWGLCLWKVTDTCAIRNQSPLVSDPSTIRYCQEALLLRRSMPSERLSPTGRATHAMGKEISKYWWSGLQWARWALFGWATDCIDLNRRASLGRIGRLNSIGFATMLFKRGKTVHFFFSHLGLSSHFVVPAGLSIDKYRGELRVRKLRKWPRHQ